MLWEAVAVDLAESRFRSMRLCSFHGSVSSARSPTLFFCYLHLLIQYKVKTGLQDTCGTLDTSWMPFFSKLVEVQSTGNMKDTPRLFRYGSEYQVVQTPACSRPCFSRPIAAFWPMHWSCRVVWALENVRQRGASKTMLSVLRYEKSNTFAADFQALSQHTTIEHSDGRLKACLLGSQ